MRGIIDRFIVLRYISAVWPYDILFGYSRYLVYLVTKTIYKNQTYIQIIECNIKILRVLKLCLAFYTKIYI